MKDKIINKMKSIGRQNFLSNRKQRVVRIGQVSTGTSVNARARVPQESVLDPLLLLIYINDLLDNLSSNVKLLADDKSLFSVIHDIYVSTGEVNEDLKKKTATGLFNGK